MSYWESTLHKRLPRRRALAAGGSLAGAALALTLAGCSGDESEGVGETKDGSGLLFKPSDTSKQATRGGVWTSFQPQAAEGFDPYDGTMVALRQITHTYQRLLSYKVGTVTAPPEGMVEGDAASSWEVSPDGLQITFKLRASNKWDPRAPTNGRVMTTDDLKFSWDRFSRVGRSRGELVKAVNPNAPVESLTFPDNNTAVVKLAEPASAILALLAFPWYYAITPVEAADKFDIRQDMRGSGPWMLSKYTPSVGYEYRRNPNYWKTERPFLDGIDYPIITEAAQLLAQFRAKRIWGPYAPNADEVVAVKRDNPDALLRGKSPFEGQTGKYDLGVSKRDNSPYWDLRVRQAISMLIDRDEFIDAFGNVSGFRKEGIPMEVGWHGHVPCGWGQSGVWLDPKKGELGEASKYWQYNPEEAARLMRAAGKFPMETEYTYPGTGGPSTQTFRNRQQVLIEMLQRGGHFKLTVNTPEYLTIFNPGYIISDQWDGLAPLPFGSWPDIDLGIWAIYEPGGRNDYVTRPVPKAHELALQHRREPEAKKRLGIVHDWQKAMAVEMPLIPEPGEATTFQLNWPWLSNVGGVVSAASTADAADLFQHYWYDRSKDTRSG